jgi:hypothetical protein
MQDNNQQCSGSARYQLFQSGIKYGWLYEPDDQDLFLISDDEFNGSLDLVSIRSSDASMSLKFTSIILYLRSWITRYHCLTSCDTFNYTNFI